MEWNEATYKRLKNLPDSDDEKDLCEVIIGALDGLEQQFAKMSNEARGVGLEDLTKTYYWHAMTLRRAVDYVKDWKESI